MTPTPTARQHEIVQWMRAYQQEFGMPPTLREMADAFGWASLNSAIDNLRRLAKRGLVKHHGKKARGWVALAEVT
jgi:repressor LexA